MQQHHAERARERRHQELGHWSFRRVRITPRPPSTSMYARDLLGGRARLVAHDPPVGEEEHAVGVARGDRVVGHHRDRLAVLAARGGEQPQHLAAGARVEVAGRLVGEHQVGARWRARGRSRRAAAGRPRARAGGGAGAAPSPRVSTSSSIHARSVAARPAAVELERQQHVAAHVEGRHEVERLEHEPDAATAQHRERRVGELGDVGVAEPRAAGGRRVEAGHDVHERRLARARRAHDGGELAAADAERDVVERRDRACAVP